MSLTIATTKLRISRIQLKNSRRDLIAASKELLSVMTLINSAESRASNYSKLLLANLKAKIECVYINVKFTAKEAQKELRYSHNILTETRGDTRKKIEKYFYSLTRCEYFTCYCYLNIENVKKLVLETYEIVSTV